MFGKRISLAVLASLVGVSFLLAQSPPDPTQGQKLPNVQQPGTPAAPAIPTAPGAVPTAPGSPAPGSPAPADQIAPTTPTAPPPASRDLPLRPAPANPSPNPTNVGQPAVPGDNSQNSQQSVDNAQRQMSDDAKFIILAAEINLADINIGRIAAQRASRQDIRQFANRFVQDHSMNLNQLNQMVDRNRWKNGERMDQVHQQLFQKLAALQGQQFDNEFLQKMVEGHKKVVEIFKHASENCKNAEIKQYATQTLAMIRQHEQEFQRLTGQNQPQPTQPTSADINNNGVNNNGVNNNNNRTDGIRNDVNRNSDTNRNDPNRRDDR